jgi:hypothetical protein
MPRQKRTPTYQCKIRIREGLRGRLKGEATKNQTTFSGEIIDRLERSFAPDLARSLEEVAADLVTLARKRKLEPAE